MSQSDMTFALGAPSRKTGEVPGQGTGSRSWEVTIDSERGGSVIGLFIGDDGCFDIGKTISIGDRDVAADIASRVNDMGYRVQWKEVQA